MNTLRILVWIGNMVLWFLIGWSHRGHRLAKQVREINGLEAALKFEIARCRAIADAVAKPKPRHERRRILTADSDGLLH